MIRVSARFDGGPANGRYDQVPIGPDGQPPAERVLQPGVLYVGASDEPAEQPATPRYVLQGRTDDPLADWAYVHAPDPPQ